jgi:hypothetical protein
MGFPTNKILEHDKKIMLFQQVPIVGILSENEWSTKNQTIGGEPWTTNHD